MRPLTHCKDGFDCKVDQGLCVCLCQWCLKADYVPTKLGETEI